MIKHMVRWVGCVAVAVVMLQAGSGESLAQIQPQTPFKFELDDHRLTLQEGDKPVLSFVHREVDPPLEKGVKRSGYVHPLHGPDGDVLTDDFPADHPHHRGVFVGWPQTKVMGEAVDTWHMKGIVPRFVSWGAREVGEKSAMFEATNLWRLKDTRDVMREEVRYVVSAVEGAGRTIDVEIRLTNLTDEPLTLRGQVKRGYGGFNVRMDNRRPEIQIATMNGMITAKEVDVTNPPSPWADYTSLAGKNGARSGVAVFQHPGNPGYPVGTWTLRHYGFLGATWPGDVDYVVEAGGSLTLRYRLFVHRGSAAEADVAGRFAGYREATSAAAGKVEVEGASGPAVKLEQDDAAGVLKVMIDGREAVAYQYGGQFAIPHLWPVQSPSGKHLIVQQKEPFPHHRAIWLADAVQLAGHEVVDFYHDYKNLNKPKDYTSGFRHSIRHQRFTQTQVTGSTARIGIDLQWMLNNTTPVLDEHRELTITALPGGGYLIDLAWKQTAAHGDVKFTSDAVHYAWPYLRMDPQFSGEKGGTIVNDRGQTGQEATNMKPARWVSYSNTVDGVAEGLAVFLPSDERLWLTRDYGTFGPRRPDAQSGTKFTLKKGQSIGDRVGILVHSGDATTGQIAGQFEAYRKSVASSGAH